MFDDSLIKLMVFFVVFAIFLYTAVGDGRELARDWRTMLPLRRLLLLVRTVVIALLISFFLFADSVGLSEYGVWITTGIVAVLVVLRHAIQSTST